MTAYTLIESRDLFDSGDTHHYYELAAALARQGHQVTVFLVQNGVLPARRSAKSDLLTNLAASGVEVLADAFSLQERGIPADRLVSGVTAAPLDAVVDHLAEGRKALWH